MSAFHAATRSFNEIAVPLFERRFAIGECEVLDAKGVQRFYAGSTFEIAALEVEGGVSRKALLLFNEHPELLERKVRAAWLARECLRRGVKVDDSDS